MAFSYLVRSSLARARALPDLMDCRKSFRFASSGSHHNSHHLSPSTPFRFFSSQTTPREGGRESELVKKEATFRDGKGNKSDQSNKGDEDEFPTEKLFLLFGACIIIYIDMVIPAKSAYEEGVDKKNKAGFEEFKLKLLEPGFVSKIVVDGSLAQVYLKNNAKVGRVFFEPKQPTEKGVYMLGIKSPESFKEELEQTQKILRLDPVPVIDLTKNPMNQKKQSDVQQQGPPLSKPDSPRGSSFPE